MKIWIFIATFLPLTTIAQYDFESRYFTITSESLPEVPELSAFDIDFGPKRDFSIRKITDFNKVTSSNYWEAVDMAVAIEKQEKYKSNTNYNVAALQQKYNGLGNTPYAADGSTKVTNFVYKEQRGLDMMNPCPPFGICPKCAPYRLSRGY
ncbi:MAG: hypothetical protein R2776_06845 [Flavobacteriaceae bacterium]|nr:hypothetical protein [Flavobacteriaceae bacterium]